MEKHIVFESKEEAEKAIPMNEMRKIRVNEKVIGMAHTSRGFKAFQRNCPHAGADLSEGKINHLGEIICPLHGFGFDTLDGQEMGRRCRPMKFYDTVWEEDKLFVSL